jgi:hypothetical protein
VFQINGSLSEFCAVVFKLIYRFAVEMGEGDKSKQGNEERNIGPRMKIRNKNSSHISANIFHLF